MSATGPSRRPPVWVGIALVALIVGLVLLVAPGPQRIFIFPDLTWQAMQNRGAWRVGMDPSFPPFESLDAAGQPVGFDVDLARRMAQTWGMEAEIVAIGFDSLLDALQTGQIDSVVSALPYDPRETKDFAFSPPYFEAGVRLAVRAGSPIQGVESLADHTVAVEWGSLGDMVGRRLQREGKGIRLMPFATPEEAVAALADVQGADALLIDNVTLREAQGRGADIVAVGPALESNPYVIASPPRAHVLRQKIAETLEQLAAAGVITELETTWFGPLE